MTISKTVRNGLLVAAGLLAFTAIAPAQEQEVTIQMTSTWPPGIDLIQADQHFVEIVNSLGEGSIQIQFFPGESLIPSTQVFDAVRSGSIQASADWPGYWAGTDTAFSLIGSFPMFFGVADYILWIQSWGGAALFDEVYGKYDMKYLPYSLISTESGLRGNTPIASLEDLAGKRVRMSGRPQGAILAEFGASQIMLPGSEVYQSLERGVVDAAEFSMPSTDLGMGFQEVTKHQMSPGWHQPGSMSGVMINQAVWDGLSDKQKKILETAAAATMTWSLAHYEKASVEAVKKFAEAGTTVHKLSDEDMAKLQSLSNKLLVDEACANPLFAKVALSQLEYLDDYSQWRDMQGEFSLGRNLSEFPDIEAVRGCAE
ncbi:TRAP transporter substrate-binding protein DctP [Aliihoeflea sp. 40Bstr573]|uniref:TRAP transporter substrate-binding protein DctP n=1 Tax=Aliihoeflea sp. 40Bstr573 TaxID=2696467 RepID=UPI002094AC13|nr:TRAP transporter substrate-binding protein DctP [Aliihoeflea sp. 40Bstr573]MCO6388725.1 ABC transporter substrate-binding protein [Aliihoeflea sp. 40Bstr573]